VLEKFIKDNKIKTKNEQDLILFTEFLNQDWTKALQKSKF
jgi:hypothetical protein